jgi:predicted PhzF superfamily epimerase YddE/YHI9
MTLVDVVRVFTSADGSFGNELGIVQTPVADPQAVTTELGFSETVFVSSVDDGRATIRIFTPASELPFAGHPSVGTAWFLRELSVLEEQAGDVAVRYDGDLTWITGKADWAPAFEFHPLSSPAEVDAVDGASFTAGKHYVWAWIDDDTIRARMFAPSLGVPEDEATGAAAVRITTQLERDLTIHQGAGSVIYTRLLGDSVEVGGRTVFDRQISLKD